MPYLSTGSAMTTASMNSASFWANQISALSAQHSARAQAAASTASSPTASSATGGGDLVAVLVSALTRGEWTVHGRSAATAGTSASAGASAGASGGAASASQIAQD